MFEPAEAYAGALDGSYGSLDAVPRDDFTPKNNTSPIRFLSEISVSRSNEELSDQDKQNPVSS